MDEKLSSQKNMREKQLVWAIKTKFLYWGGTNPFVPEVCRELTWHNFIRPRSLPGSPMWHNFIRQKKSGGQLVMKSKFGRAGGWTPCGCFELASACFSIWSDHAHIRKTLTKFNHESMDACHVAIQTFVCHIYSCHVLKTVTALQWEHGHIACGYMDIHPLAIYVCSCGILSMVVASRWQHRFLLHRVRFFDRMTMFSL